MIILHTPFTRIHYPMPQHHSIFMRAARPFRAAGRAFVFFMKIFPMLPSRAVDWVTKPPVVEKVRYPTSTGMAEGELYRPAGSGPHPGIMICLGVVPFGVDHPQVPVMGRAFARAGFVNLMFWSPSMRDFRLDPADVENFALAYEWFIDQPYVDPARSGLLGTCVGGAFALMAAADARVRDRAAFVSAYAPFNSMWTFARDIASASRCNDSGDESVREPWKVDQLTRKVFVHSMTAWLEPAEGEQLRSHFLEADDHGPLPEGLSQEGRVIYDLLNAPGVEEAEAALQRLSPAMRARFDALSPQRYLADIHAPRMLFLHDVGDQVIPVGESRRMQTALAGRAGVRYTEMHFQHLDPVKGRLPLLLLVRELAKFLRAVFPLFWQSVGS